MATDSKAIQQYDPEGQRLALLAEYKPQDHLMQWTAFNKRTNKTDTIIYYPAAWRLYELRLKYPTAKFDIDLLVIDQERNFCIVRAKLYTGKTYEESDIRAVAHKQGLLSELDKVETKCKARAARDVGIGTEHALDLDDVSEGEIVGGLVSSTIINEDRGQATSNVIEASQSNGQRRLPQPSANDGSPTEQQMSTIAKLQKQLGEPQSNLDGLSFEDCGALIREYSQRLQEKRKSA